MADMADALLTDRPYRQALDPIETLRILHGDCVAGQLCPDSVDAFTDYVAERLSSAEVQVAEFSTESDDDLAIEQQ